MMMNEQKKSDRVRVLGIQVDPLRVDRAVHVTGRLLEKHKFEYIVFANTPAALAGLDESYLDQAALVLPGDRNIEDAAETRGWLEEDKSYQAEYFRRIFGKLNRQGASVYLAVEKENDLLKVQQIISERYKWLSVRSSLWEEGTSVDSRINDVNSFAPDVLFICGPHSMIQDFMKEHSCKLLAGICFCMESIATDADSDIPAWMIGSRLQKAYMEGVSRISRFLHNFVFKRKMKAIAQEEQNEVLAETEEMSEEEEKTGKPIDETENSKSDEILP